MFEVEPGSIQFCFNFRRWVAGCQHTVACQWRNGREVVCVDPELMVHHSHESANLDAEEDWGVPLGCRSWRKQCA
jgi:hypothetical protein